MTRSRTQDANRRRLALLGLAGAVVTGVGDVLMFGRSCSGPDFDRAAGVVPVDVDADPTWRSLWNGTAVPPRRVHAGVLLGLAGIGLQWAGMHGLARKHDSEMRRRIAIVPTAVFAVAGGVTHQCCGTVIEAYRTASMARGESPGHRRPSPRSATGLLAVSAAGTLAALAVTSAGTIVVARRTGGAAALRQSIATPFPWVLATLLTFGRLPAPIGGYLRPASISTGLIISFAITASPARTDP